MSLVRSYKNVVCLPCRGCENKALFPHAWGGVYDENHNPIKAAFLRREYRRDISLIEGLWDRSTGQEIKVHDLIKPDQVGHSSKWLGGSYIFAGYLFPHYGHFLLESLANLWFFKQHPETPIIWLGVHNQPELGPLEREFIDLFNIKNPIYILTEQTEVEELIVPEPGYRIHTRYTPEQVAALKVMDAPTPVEGKKVWLSRSKLDVGGIDNEFVLEKHLKENGWIIFHPEEHSIKDQLTMLCDAEKIAGIEGSALHTLVMMPDYKGEVHIFARRSRVEFDFIFIAETLSLDQKIHMCLVQRWSHDLPKWSYNRFWLKLDPVLRALGEKGPQKPAIQPPGNLKKVVKGIIDHFNFRTLVEFWPKDSVIGDIGPKRRSISISRTLEVNVRSLPENIDHLDITSDQLFTSNLLKVDPDIYCFRHQSDEQKLIRAFNSSIIRSKPISMWVIEYYADERDIADENFVPFDARVASANTTLVHYIDKCCPMISIARIRQANIAVAWRQPKEMFHSSLSDFSALKDAEEFDRCPILRLNDIGNIYKDYMVKTNQSS